MVFAETLPTRDDTYARNCARPLAAIREAATTTHLKPLGDPRHAALYFMIAAHPDSSVVSELTRDMDAVLDRMSLAFTSDEIHDTVTISNLPGTLSPVKARIVYVQTPTEKNDATELHAAWRIEVEMTDNWYEAYVSASDPSTIISSIDWASDSPRSQSGGSLNALEAKLAAGTLLKAKAAGTYTVWKWGINDPDSGQRSVEDGPHDTLASPLGWHTISEVNNPDGGPAWLGKHTAETGGETYLNFATTWGNNVRSASAGFMFYSILSTGFCARELEGRPEMGLQLPPRR
jgi:extracellular elastinolytic metalloproteinase